MLSHVPFTAGVVAAAMGFWRVLMLEPAARFRCLSGLIGGRMQQLGRQNHSALQAQGLCQLLGLAGAGGVGEASACQRGRIYLHQGDGLRQALEVVHASVVDLDLQAIESVSVVHAADWDGPDA